MKTKSIMILSRKPEIHSTRRLVEVLEKRGVSWSLKDPESEDWDDAELIFPRLGTWRFQEALEKLLPKSEMIRFINSLQSYQKTRNKWHSLQMLGYHQIQAPLTQMMDREEFKVVDLQFPFILKENYSSQGQGVFLIHNPMDLEKVMVALPETQLFLVQEYIKECHGEDLRIFVTRHGDHFSILRRNTTGDVRSNLHTGGKPYPTEALAEELNQAFQTLEIFGLDYAGVDILRSQEGPLVIEVNPCPGFEGLEAIHGPVVAEKIIDLGAKSL